MDSTKIPDEAIDDDLKCCVCMELLYKPIILPCGDISCFWCVHKAMSGVSESRCPKCRSPYGHFPAICQLLHFLLLKMYPVEYKRRENEVLEEEKKQRCFSPQLSNDLSSSHASQGSNVIDTPSTSSSGDCDLLSVNDVLCVACKQLLFRPAALNCGHVYCKSCISTIAHEALRCEVCQSLHPKGCVKVCQELDHLLEKKFPEEYAQRKEALQLLPIHDQQVAGLDGTGGEKKCSSPLDLNPSSMGTHAIKLHVAVGCDYCGMYPIVGDRYRCKDCVEEMGFDLCGDCYNTSSELPGRFNQQHTSEHKFDLVQTSVVLDAMMRRFVLPDNAPQDQHGQDQLAR
ncbi:hypothetical protein ACHQM5_027872 [Ranunculus cassubicifolius]